MKKVDFWTSILFILAGLILTLLSIYLNEIYPGLVGFGKILINFLQVVGLTIFTSGVISIILITRDWKNYFEDRIKKIILEQSFLNSLDNEYLINLQIKTLKAFFKTNDIDRQGSFLNYFQQNLSDYIKEPYRQDVKTEIIINEIDDRTLSVIDRIYYTCRQVGGKVQEYIRWVPDKDEFHDIDYVQFKVTQPEGKTKKVLDLKKEGTNYTLSANGTTENLSIDQIYENGLCFSLKEYNEDGLIIEVKSKYIFDIRKFFVWQMAHPTRDFYISIKYPETWKIVIKPLVIHENRIIQDNENGYYSMTYDGWMLPKSGVVYKFLTE